MRKYPSGQSILPIALLVMILWGSLFPMVKLGYAAFSMDTAKPANLLLYAGVRFMICGGVLTGICRIRGKRLRLNGREEWINMGMVSIFAVILHYSLTYTGLSMTDSGKTALLKQLCSTLFICFSFLFFKEDKFSPWKLCAAALGLLGIAALNSEAILTSGSGFGVGEWAVLGASLCTVIANIASKKLTRHISPLAIAGESQLAGGIVLTLCGLLGGGSLGTISLHGVLIFVYILIASCISYGLWYAAVAQAGLSQLFIIKFLEPVFAGIFSACLLGERVLTLPYLSALALTFGAILLSGLAERRSATGKK